MPVPELMSMAPISGSQLPRATFRIHSTRKTRIVNQTAAADMRSTRIVGTGVSIVPTRAVPTKPRMKMVSRSPRHAARGGVMLSAVSFREKVRALTRIESFPTAQYDKGAHEATQREGAEASAGHAGS